MPRPAVLAHRGASGYAYENSLAAFRLAREMGAGHTIVTVLCDSGSKYLSRLFNREWLAQKGLLEAAGFAPGT